MPDTLKLVHTVEVGSMVRAEASAHERFRERRTRGEWFDISEDEAVTALDEIARAYPPTGEAAPTQVTGAATDAASASDLGAQALALMLANMAGRYGVLTKATDQDALPFTGEVLIMEASWRLLRTDDDEGRRFFGEAGPFVVSPDDEEDGAL